MSRKNIFGFLLLFVFTLNLFGPVIQNSLGVDTGTAVTAYADDNGILDVEEGEGGITIGPGQYPSLNGGLEETIESANEVLSRYQMVERFILAVIVLLLLAVLIISITKFAAAGDDSGARKKAMTGILFCGIAIALIGGLAIIVSLAQNLFK